MIEATAQGTTAQEARHDDSGQRRRSVQQMAEQCECGWLRASEFNSLEVKDREFIILSMEDRGMVLHPVGGKLMVMNAEVLKKPVEIVGVIQPFTFGIPFEDCRIPESDDIHFTVLNALDEGEAWDKLRRFLNQLQKVELNLVPMEFDEC